MLFVFLIFNTLSILEELANIEYPYPKKKQQQHQKTAGYA
jgi:hypothetical protein